MGPDHHGGTRMIPEVVEVHAQPGRHALAGSSWATGSEATGRSVPVPGGWPSASSGWSPLMCAAEVHASAPILSAELPETGERFLRGYCHLW